MNNGDHSLIQTYRSDLSIPGNFAGNGWGDFSINNSLGIGYTLTGNRYGSGNLFASGNIGIGTTDTQGYKLAVNGNAIAESVTVKLHSVWPDYVFRKDYTLPALMGVKSYIDKHHHLPDMPSADQIAKEGINLGEINKILTKKVEELTLYIINSDQEIKKQQDISKDQLNTNKVLQDQINQLKAQLDILLKQK